MPKRPSDDPQQGPRKLSTQSAEQRKTQAHPPVVNSTAAAAMRLGGHLTSRVVTRSKARGGDGISSDSELLSVVLQPQAVDSVAAGGKGDLMRKPAPQVPGQAPMSASVVPSARTSLTNGTTAAPAAAPPAALTGPAATKPRHQRSASAGQGTTRKVQLQADVADDLASIADTLVRVCAEPADQQEQQQHEQGQQKPPTAAAAGSLQRRSSRLVAAATAALGSSTATDTSTASRLDRASAPVGRQYSKRSASNSLAASRRTPPAPTAVATAAAATAAAATAAAAITSLVTPASAGAAAPASTPMQQPCRSASSDPGSGSARRVRFAAGPLDPSQHRNSTDDGHPAGEGLLAVPVRRVPVSYGMDLSRGNVLMLEQLLGAECSMSVTRLKRRVGLLPPIRPPRPHASSPGGGPAAAESPGQQHKQLGKRA